MKEATGELNLTVIVVIIVALLSLFFFSILWPSIQSNFSKNTKCDEAICLKENVSADGKEVKCTYRNKNGEEENITCAGKG